MKFLIKLVREILHLSGKIQGKVREFQKPLAIATMNWPNSMRIIGLIREFRAMLTLHWIPF